MELLIGLRDSVLGSLAWVVENLGVLLLVVPMVLLAGVIGHLGRRVF